MLGIFGRHLLDCLNPAHRARPAPVFSGIAVVWGLGLLVVASLLCGCAAAPPAAATAPPLPTSAQAGATTIVAVAPPASSHMTLPEFLGLKGLAGGVRMVSWRVRDRLATRFPILEPSSSPVTSLTDPANSSEDASPAQQAAADAKAEADLAPQKAKAIKYLASLGCGECYPDTAEALLAALEDCNEMIRFETVQGLRKSIGGACQSCRQNSCCTPELLKKLYELAYGKDHNGCFIEPSARVRRCARLVVAACGCSVEGDASFETSPMEGPSAAGAESPTAEPIPAPDPVAGMPNLPQDVPTLPQHFPVSLASYTEKSLEVPIAADADARP